jgi:hypothetical protein
MFSSWTHLVRRAQLNTMQQLHHARKIEGLDHKIHEAQTALHAAKRDLMALLQQEQIELCRIEAILLQMLDHGLTATNGLQAEYVLRQCAASQLGGRIWRATQMAQQLEQQIGALCETAERVHARGPRHIVNGQVMTFLAGHSPVHLRPKAWRLAASR